MLVLSRKKSQQVMIDDQIRVTVLRINGNSVRIGIEGPDEVRIVRAELQELSPMPPEVSQPNNTRSIPRGQSLRPVAAK